VAVAAESGRASPFERASAFLFRHARLKLALILGWPLTWFVFIYLGALAVLLFSAFWRLDAFTGLVVKNLSTSNLQRLLDDPVYRTIALRTVGIATAVTLTDIVLAFPLAYYVARLAKPRMRNVLLMAVVIPLWANYLVRIFAWKLILSQGGFLGWLFGLVGVDIHVANTNIAVWITFVYLWLPFTFLPIYGALERVPSSYLEASSDLGGRGWMTFRRVVLPIIAPGVVAGSIFSFSLTLGDYITPTLVGNTRFIGNVIYDSQGIAGDIPFAAAFALVPIAIMTMYLVIAWRLKAFEAL
jgi:putative spermidine/putrescine transport system permease protein